MCFKKVGKIARGLASPSKMIWRASKGQNPIKQQGPTTFRNLVDEGNLLGINPPKPLEDMSAEEQEAERQKRISANVANINSAYAGREGQYKAFADALRQRFGSDLNRQYESANRNLRFELAGAGLTGGSVARDQGRDLSREMAEGTVAAESKVNEAEAGLRGQDENARLQLISLAQTGGDIGNPAMQASNMLRANLQNAQGGTAAKLGDVFGSTAATYKQLQDARNLRRGLTSSYEQIYGSGIGRPQVGVR